MKDVRGAHLSNVRWLFAEGTEDSSVRIIDVRWYLQGKDGREEYARGHIPGAVFVALEDITADQGPGRHPIPSAEKFQEAMRAAGVSRGTHVVAYDDAGGSIAARLLWLLRRFGHTTASVLDGGLAAWTAAGRALTTEVPRPARGDFEAKPDPSIVSVNKAHVDAARARRFTHSRRTRGRAIPRRSRTHRRAARAHPRREERAVVAQCPRWLLPQRCGIAIALRGVGCAPRQRDHRVLRLRRDRVPRLARARIGRLRSGEALRGQLERLGTRPKLAG